MLRQKGEKMEFKTRLLACTTTPKSSIEGFMECYVLNSYVQIGDFLVVATPTGSAVVGKLIDVSRLNDICVSKIDVEGENYLFLDNGQDENKKHVVYFRFGNQS